VFVFHNGNRTSRKIGDKKAAEVTASKIRVQLQGGKFGFEEEKPLPSFGEYADSWINTTVPATCKASTVRDYQDLLRIHVLPVFKETRINDITRGKVKDFLLGKINKGFAKSTVFHMKNVVSGVLNRALDDEIIQANAALSLGKNFLKDNGQGKDVDPLTKDELAWLLRVAEALYSEHHALLLTLARTGMRVGEALTLRWGDIDFRGRFIMVSKGFSRGREETTKSDKARRVDV
jgi:integrase